MKMAADSESAMYASDFRVVWQYGIVQYRDDEFDYIHNMLDRVNEIASGVKSYSDVTRGMRRTWVTNFNKVFYSVVHDQNMF